MRRPDDTSLTEVERDRNGTVVNVIKYPEGSRWQRCLRCGHRWFGYMIDPRCPQPNCSGDCHADWRPDTPDGPLEEGSQ